MLREKMHVVWLRRFPWEEQPLDTGEGLREGAPAPGDREGSRGCAPDPGLKMTSGQRLSAPGGAVQVRRAAHERCAETASSAPAASTEPLRPEGGGQEKVRRGERGRGRGGKGKKQASYLR